MEGDFSEQKRFQKKIYGFLLAVSDSWQAHRLESRAMNSVQSPDLTQSFSIDLRVYYEDTDAGGVVYYANYFKFMERCRTEWVRSLGYGQAELAVQHQAVFVVRSAQANYLKPARLDDLLRVEMVLETLGRASLSVRQQVIRLDQQGQTVLVTGQIQLACVHPETFRPVPLPSFLMSQLQEFL